MARLAAAHASCAVGRPGAGAGSTRFARCAFSVGCLLNDGRFFGDGAASVALMFAWVTTPPRKVRQQNRHRF